MCYFDFHLMGFIREPSKKTFLEEMSAKGVGALFRQENVSFHYFFFKCLEYNEMKEYAKQFSNIFVRVFAKT